MNEAADAVMANARLQDERAEIVRKLRFLASLKTGDDLELLEKLGWSINNWGDQLAELAQQAADLIDPTLALREMRSKLSDALEAHLSEMKPNYDDSIVGFNEAWDLMRKVFEREINRHEATP